MRRVAVIAPLPLVVALAFGPADTAPGGVVVTLNSSAYLPGSQSLPADTLRVLEGSDLTYANLDPLTGHTVTSKERDAENRRLFNSGTVGSGETAPVSGVAALRPGSYDFFCALHPSMLGTLVIVEAP